MIQGCCYSRNVRSAGRLQPCPQAEPSIPELHVEVLEQVLQHVDLHQRMRSCALVCSTWHMAAVAVTNTINLDFKEVEDADSASSSLTSWLEAHATTARVDSISIIGGTWWCGGSWAMLPVNQLASLRHLSLNDLEIDFICERDSGDGGVGCGSSSSSSQTGSLSASFLPLGLSALTCLELRACAVHLNNLTAFTKLHHLTLLPRDPLDEQVYQASVNSLSVALSGMQHLTHLCLGGCLADDTVLAGVRDLPNLQELLLHDSICTAESFQQLPKALTELYLDLRTLWPTADPYGLTLSHSTTPGFVHATALRCLDLGRNVYMHPALQADMPQLQLPTVEDAPVAVGCFEDDDGPIIIMSETNSEADDGPIIISSSSESDISCS